MDKVSIIFAREVLEFTEEQCALIIDREESEEFKVVEIKQTGYDSEKHFVEKTVIIKRLSDEKFFKGEYADWGSGGKEWYEDFKEVFPKQITITIYE